MIFTVRLDYLGDVEAYQIDTDSFTDVLQFLKDTFQIQKDFINHTGIEITWEMDAE
jgi:hypothetical protein